MKRLLACLVILTIPSFAFADGYCSSGHASGGGAMIEEDSPAQIARSEAVDAVEPVAPLVASLACADLTGTAKDECESLTRLR